MSNVGLQLFTECGAPFRTVARVAQGSGLQHKGGFRQPHTSFVVLCKSNGDASGDYNAAMARRIEIWPTDWR
jgi:hypothetical protein